MDFYKKWIKEFPTLIVNTSPSLTTNLYTHTSTSVFNENSSIIKLRKYNRRQVTESLIIFLIEKTIKDYVLNHAFINVKKIKLMLLQKHKIQVNHYYITKY